MVLRLEHIIGMILLEMMVSCWIMVQAILIRKQHIFRFTLRRKMQSEFSLERQVVIELRLDIQQRNNLRTGVRLAAELTPIRANHRKFITISCIR